MRNYRRGSTKLKKYFHIFFGVLVLCAGLLSPAHGAESSAPPRIGVIDLREAIFSSKVAKRENDALKKQHQRDTERLKSLEAKLRSNNIKLEKEGAAMSSKSKEALLAQLQKDLASYQELGERLQNALRETEAKFLESQRPRVEKAIAEITKKQNIHIVLAKDTLVYSRNNIDITKEVIRYLDKNK